MNELVIFDVDDTVIKGQSQQLFLNFLYKEKYISLLYYVRLSVWFVLYKLGFIKDPRSAMQYAFSFVKNKTETEIQVITDSFFDSVLKNKIYPESKEIIRKHQSNNRQVILLSNAVDILIKKIATYLNVKDYISTKLEISDGKYTGNIVGNIIYGKMKIGAVENYVATRGASLYNSWGYADHDSDIAMLSLTTHPVAVNPTEKLKKYAKKMNWPIINFQL